MELYSTTTAPKRRPSRKPSLRWTFPSKFRHLETYRQINHELWQALEQQEIKQDILRVRRFELLLEALGVSGIPDELSTMYTEQLGLCSDLMDGAYEVLQALCEASRIAIVTNGLQAVQRSRLHAFDDPSVHH